MPDDLQELKQLIAALTKRVYRLEQAAGIAATPVAAPPAPDVVPPADRPALEPPLTTPTAPPRPPLFLASVQQRREALESQIGSHVFNRIGIVAVLIGVSLFLKYAFDNNWIGPAGRVSIGLMAGIAVVFWSERFRSRGYVVFSYSLKAIGIGTMYLSLWAAFQLYHLVPGGVAFAAMAAVTAATAVLAISQDAEILAAFAIVGGFATPLLLSTGVNREVALFSYVALLDAATLVLVAFRPWMRLLIASFAGTLILYVGWNSSFYHREFLGLTIFFVSLFFVIFALAPLVALRRPTQSVAAVPRTLLILPLFNAGVYFLEMYDMLERVNRPATAWLAVVLAAVYLVLSRQMHVRARDKAGARVLNLLYIGLAVGFLTTAIPLKLDTHWITLGWLAESAVLLWVAFRGQNALLKVLATAALALGVGRLLLFDNFHPAHLVFNARFATYLVAIAALAWGVSLVRNSDSETERQAAAMGVVLLNVLFITALTLEVRDYFLREVRALEALRRGSRYQYSEWRHLSIVRDFGYSAVWMTYGATLMAVGFWKRSAFLRWQALVLIAFTIGKVFIYDTSQLDRGYRIVSFIALGVLLLAVSFVYQRDWLRLSGSRQPTPDAAKGRSAPA